MHFFSVRFDVYIIYRICIDNKKAKFHSFPQLLMSSYFCHTHLSNTQTVYNR